MVIMFNVGKQGVLHMKLVVLSGGTGTPKLIEGLRRILDDKEITVIVNVADNFWWNGLYVAPDVDTVLYLFANLLDTEKYWGIIGDTFNFLQQAKVYGIEMDWFNIGDKDLAVHLVRTMLLKKGYTLTQVTKYLAKRLDISAHILPATDDHIETYVLTNLGNLHIQEFLVKYRFQPEVYGITFPG
ncbi:MAG: 2-phospho-L-lactate transferase, partial [Thermoprotei archaeon]